MVLPALPGFTFSAYISAAGGTSPTNLALSTAGPTTGPLAGQATQMAPGQTVILTGIGVSQFPPAAPANGIIVYPNFIFGRGAYGQVRLDDVKLPHRVLGEVTTEPQLMLTAGGEEILTESLTALERSWAGTFREVLG